MIWCAVGYGSSSATRFVSDLRLAQASPPTDSGEEESASAGEADVGEPTAEPQADEASESTSETEPFADEASEPTSETEPLADEASEPMSETEPLADEASEPTSEAEPLADEASETEPLADEASEPTSEAEPLADEASEPTSETEPLADEASEPTSETEPLADETSEPEPPPGQTPESTPEPEPRAEKAPETIPEPEPLAGPNQIKNGDFESEYNFPAPLRSCITPVRRGLCALEITCDGQKNPPCLRTNMVPLGGAKGFTAQVWTYTTRIDYGALILAFWMDNAEEKWIQPPMWVRITEPEQGWTCHRIHVKAEEWPKVAATVGIYVLWFAEDGSPSGKTYLDDIALVLD
jgi:hypothetical protein